MKTFPTAGDCAATNSKARRGRGAAAAFAACALMALTAGAAHATTVTEGVGLLDTYTGPRPAADLDVTSASSTYSGVNIFLSATMDGNIGTTHEGIYIWGVDRGLGTELLAAPPGGITDTTVPVGQGVPFDAFIFLDNAGHGNVFLLTNEARPHVLSVTPLAAGAVTISGRTISAVIPRSMLPDQGAGIAHYGYNIWPRFNDIGSNTRVTDFLPDDRNFEGSAVPEPAVWATMITGFGLAGATVRRRRRVLTA